MVILGLRGAVGFSLAVVLDQEAHYRELFVSAALVMVFFTVFVQVTAGNQNTECSADCMQSSVTVLEIRIFQGSTVKPLVQRLDIQLKDPVEMKISVEMHIQVR